MHGGAAGGKGSAEAVASITKGELSALHSLASSTMHSTATQCHMHWALFWALKTWQGN